MGIQYLPLSIRAEHLKIGCVLLLPENIEVVFKRFFFSQHSLKPEKEILNDLLAFFIFLYVFGDFLLF